MANKNKNEPEIPEIHRFDARTATVEGKTWINGIGNTPCDVVIVDTWPSDEVRRSQRPFTDRSGKVLTNMLHEVGLSPQRCYATYAIKFPIAQGKKPSARDRKICQTMLREEIERANPRVVVALGNDAWASLVDVRAYPHGKSRGEPLEIDGRTYFATFNLGQVMMNGGEYFRDDIGLDQVPPHVLVHDAVREMRIVRDLADGVDVRAAWDDARPSYTVIRTAQDARAFREYLQAAYPDGALICLDCEWEGDNWLDPKRYIRTVQMGFDKGLAVIFELTDAGGVDVTDDRDLVMGEIRAILEWERTGVVGHNVISDGQWLLQEGVDIRNRVVYDTMLGQYLLGEDGPFGLEECAMRHAPYGRYCGELERWVHAHAKECRHGFGAVPRDILLPYGAADVDCLRYIMEAQIPRIRELGYMEPRGTEREYPSILDETLNTQRVLYELEGTGMPVDRERLNSMIDAFQSKKAELLAQVVTGAAVAGMPDFNPGSSAQVRRLLFEVLGLPPVKTTAGKDWAESVGNRGLDEELDVSAATDKQTLEILGDRHPLVHALLQFRRIDQYCKTWLRHADPKNPGRGIEGQMWADGRLHSHMSQLSTTSRFKSSSPNCFPREVEVLTSKGWMHWDEAYEKRYTGLLLAQWDVDSPTRDITFAKPEVWYVGRNTLIHAYTDRQLDIVATPDHKFEVFSRRDVLQHKTVTTSTLQKCAEYVIPQAGTLAENTGTTHLADHDVTLICAMQADGYIVPQGGVEITVTKPRKAERIREALNAGEWTYRESQDTSSSGKPRMRFYIGKKNNGLALAKYKFFGDWLFQFDVDSLRRLSDEVFNWDGCRTGETRNNYASSVKSNTDWVQILQLLFNRRAHFREYAAASGNTSYQVDVAERPLTHLANLKTEVLPETDVYCVTMPKHSVIVRYNGRVLFTRQSQNFPKKAEGFLTEVFGEGNVPPVLRTIIVPPDGMVMMEADFQQAELFTIASLSGDQHMIDVLKTPGRDMHTSIAAKAFGYRMFDENHREWTEDDIVELVAKQYGGDAENDEFKTWQKHLVFRDAHGNEMSYSQFKSGPRISGKNVNFGSNNVNCIVRDFNSYCIPSGDPVQIDAPPTCGEKMVMLCYLHHQTRRFACLQKFPNRGARHAGTRCARRPLVLSTTPADGRLRPWPVSRRPRRLATFLSAEC